MEREPQEYPKRILFAVTGLSPQVITESLYALAVARKPSYQPTEIHLITTSEGAERARLSLLSDEPGWFHCLCRDYRLRAPAFGAEHIHTLEDASDNAMQDIREPKDNEQAADMIIERVRRITLDPDTSLHVSIAGGRKTMGFYAGYALSLYGRPQDRLSHVLVSAPFESHPDFFYPTPYGRVIYTPPPDSKPLDTSKAEVTLAEIPFVRLRDGLPERLRSGQSNFTQTVAAAQRALLPPELVIDLAEHRITAAGEAIHLAPAELAFYSWMARRRILGRRFVRWDDEAIGQEFLTEYRNIVGEMSGEHERVEDALNSGMNKDYFDQRKSKTNGALKQALGEQLSRPYLIAGKGGRPKTRFGILLEPEQIRFQRSLIPQTGIYEAGRSGNLAGTARISGK